MINSIYIVIMISLLIIVCLCTSLTDFKYGKIYNKQLILFLCICSFIQISWFINSIVIGQTEVGYLMLRYFVNLSIGACIGITMYYYNIWAAGDAKLYILVLSLIPVLIYPSNKLNIFPGFVILVIIFTLGFLYITIETLFLFIREKHSDEFSSIGKYAINKDMLTRTLPTYIFTYIFILVYNNTLATAFPQFYLYNVGILKFISFLLILLILNRNLGKLFYIASISIGIVYLVINVLFFSKGLKFTFDISLLLLVIAVIIIRQLSSRYNYKKIKCNDLKPGMILSSMTVIGFLNSRVKGLPCYATESPHSRLSLDEVESIKRWAKSKNGKEDVYIVRHIPFAPFISLGTIVYVFYILINMK